MIICCVRKPLICQLPCTGVFWNTFAPGSVSETAPLLGTILPSMGTLCKRLEWSCRVRDVYCWNNFLKWQPHCCPGAIGGNMLIGLLGKIVCRQFRVASKRSKLISIVWRRSELNLKRHAYFSNCCSNCLQLAFLRNVVLTLSELSNILIGGCAYDSHWCQIWCLFLCGLKFWPCQTL